MSKAIPLRRGQNYLSKGRLKQGGMNQTEKAYHDLLPLRFQAREILWFRFEGLELRLADNTFYPLILLFWPPIA
jgi:hypothetical protein